MSAYDAMIFKIPNESPDYQECSSFVIRAVESIIQDTIDSDNNKIIINTNLKLGLPMENINKIAGPFIEAWAVEVFTDALSDANNQYALIHVEAQHRLAKSDVILQFRKKRKAGMGVTAEVDVKATAEDIPNSGKSPNITSFAIIRTAYIEDPDYLFVILSIKHRVYCIKNSETGLMDGIMEVTDHKAYDLKYLSARDLNYNPSLGVGQIQIRDIHYVTLEYRQTWDFCQLLDQKFLASSRRTFGDWLELAQKNGWVKNDE